MGRLIALLLGGFGLGAYLRRRKRRQPASEYSPADELLRDQFISPGDVDLLSLTDDVDEAVELVIDCYERRCAHTSARAV